MTNDLNLQPAVAVVGGAGRVGAALSLYLADTHEGQLMVRVVDINEDAIQSMASGQMPHMESEAPEILKAALMSGDIEFSSDDAVIRDAQYVFVTVGTPVRHNMAHSTDMSQLYSAFDNIADNLQEGQIIILKSSVPVGTSRTLIQRLESKTGMIESEDWFFAYSPERAVEGVMIPEFRRLPVILGSKHEVSRQRAERFLMNAFPDSRISLNLEEAEFGKLMVNTYRYIEFAAANEFATRARQLEGVDNIHRVIAAFSADYPRFNMPGPGANVGGPCLSKDGWLLHHHMMGGHLARDAWNINETMPRQIAHMIINDNNLKQVGVLGETFKADSDNTVGSTAPTLVTELAKAGRDVRIYDPFTECNDVAELDGCDAVALFTPHSAFKDIAQIALAVGNPDCQFIDVWGFWQDQLPSAVNWAFRYQAKPW